MTITRVQPDDHHHLQKIAKLLVAASKIVTVTGAGISTNAGIPDFRSKNKKGIYSTGYRDLFRSSALSHPEDRRLFYRHIADMRRAAERANPTRTHHFIRDLRDSGKLVRDYTPRTSTALKTRLASRPTRERAREVDLVSTEGPG
ncbi:DHS-like NAD/FAD-binding domain-containing protein [Parathielavia hyrcaniae]|uniref:DHS-like NAD/FAD-binding domain-containing protein n=1 Tax=Parathielavia hyrcaniae TaxID=113614 RepID=A0AAN6SX78_9PEZI|nr:DHS-like NAD/FAD-binding domain-containing protein [Parathielavia hyrcaniae]